MPGDPVKRANSFPGRLKAAMDPEVEKKLGSLIAREDECMVALEVSKDDGGKPRIIAIVCPQRSSSQPEYALFVLKKRKLRSKFMIRLLVPILSDFSVRRLNTNSVEVKYRKYREKTKTKLFTASNAEALSKWIEVASNAVVVACHQNYNLDSFCHRKSHTWLLERYDDVSSLKQMIKGPSAKDTAANSDDSDSGDAADHPVALSMMTNAARSDWIQRQCMKRADEFVEKRKISVRVCSWNVGALLRPEEGKGIPWPAEVLQQWLIPRGTKGCDIVSVGLQEIVELQTNSLIAHDSSPERTAWEELLCAALGRQYVPLVSRQYVGIYHFLAVKRELWEGGVVREPQCKAVGCGIMGFGGNKGAVSVRLVVYDSDVCFVCCHLAAGRLQVERRNRDQKLILKSTLFDGKNLHGVIAPNSGSVTEAERPEKVCKPVDNSMSGVTGSDLDALRAKSEPGRGPEPTGFASAGRLPSGRGHLRQNSFGSSFAGSSFTSSFTSAAAGGGPEPPSSTGSAGMLVADEEDAGDGREDGREDGRQRLIEDHDAVVWFGDLNYRVDMDREEALHLITAGELRPLWERDQLRRQREEGVVFVDYAEGRPLFNPTYKLDPATGDYYARSDKIRTPSWCDRVLWRTARSECRQLSHAAEEELTGSDHRAIGTTLELTVEEAIAAKRARVREAVEAELDQLTGECQPQAAVDMEEVTLSSVRYRRREKREVRLRNVGQVAVHFSVATAMRGHATKAAWMQVTPDRGVLMPQESIRLDIVVHVGDRVATAILCDGVTTLEALVTFHVDGGLKESDPTVAVTAHCLPTCFGRSLEALAARSSPVRAPPAKPQGAAGGGEEGGGGRSLLPREVWRLVGALNERGLRTHRLFLDYGSTTEAAEARECLDTGRGFPASISAHALGEVLLQLLRSMPVPVVTPAVRDQCVLKFQSAPAVTEALQKLPPHHTTALVYLVAFLRTLALHQKHNSVSVDELALVFAGALLSPDRLARNRVARAVLGELHREQAVMLHLINPSWRTSSMGATAS